MSYLRPVLDVILTAFRNLDLFTLIPSITKKTIRLIWLEQVQSGSVLA
jgi:hypothetical protein